MSKSTRITLLIVVLIIATFFRFYHFTSTPPGLYPDEAADGNNAVEVAETGHAQPFYIEDNGREGLYVNIIAAFLKVWPVYEPWVIRLPAAVAGVLTVLGLYLLVAELVGPEIGLLSAFLLATNFWHINFSRIGFRAILAPLLLTWTLYLLLKAFKSEDKARGTLYALLGGAVYGLGFYTYIAYRVTPLLFLLFVPFFKHKADFWKRTGLFLFVAILIALPIGVYFLQHPGDFFGRTSQISVTNSGNPLGHFAVNLGKTLAMFNVHGDDNWRHNISGAPELFPLVGLLFLVGFILGIAALIKTWRMRNIPPKKLPPGQCFTLLLMFAWFALAILPEAASDEGIPHSLRAILMIPPVLFFAALGGVRLYKFLANCWNKTTAQVLGLIFAAFVVKTAYSSYFVLWAQNPNVPGAFNANYVTIGREINALPSSTPKYVIVSAGGVLERGIPVPAQTTMFITHSFTLEDQTKTNIHYLLPEALSQIPKGTPSSTVFEIN